MNYLVKILGALAIMTSLSPAAFADDDKVYPGSMCKPFTGSKRKPVAVTSPNSLLRVASPRNESRASCSWTNGKRCFPFRTRGSWSGATSHEP